MTEKGLPLVSPSSESMGGAVVFNVNKSRNPFELIRDQHETQFVQKVPTSSGSILSSGTEQDQLVGMPFHP